MMKFLASVVLCLATIVLMAQASFAADRSMFNYQGRVLVQGYPYTGPGQMKVAILATTGTSTVYSLWSNDGSSVAGAEPTGAFGVTATGGVFDVMIGDTNLMSEVPAIIFNRDDELKIRVWFNDGTHGFQQLTPDRRLTNPRRLGVAEIRNDTTLYVNASTGNDLNSGLSASSAKKTIQAAIDMLPGRLFANTTIDIADGVYRESVVVSGITATKNKYLTLKGDEQTTPTVSVSPNVRITGADNDQTHEKVRQHCLEILDCHGIKTVGITFDYAGYQGVRSTGSRLDYLKCKATNCSESGFFDGMGERAYYMQCVANNNGYAGFEFYGVNGWLESCIATQNQNGVWATQSSTVWVIGGSYYSNSYQGLKFWTNAVLVGGQPTPYPAIYGNGQYGVELEYRSLLKWYAYLTFPGGNGISNIHSDTGSGYY
ncbi:hypothetical protein LLG95_08480 [bacterium]|nr:hypothetical protein [bacterium]